MERSFLKKARTIDEKPTNFARRSGCKNIETHNKSNPRSYKIIQPAKGI
jgi:hypothetical protein